ncbi:MAG TPA: roadblock/LC7 domain-containing protein [Thermoplasmata archaeon]|nr:roadblock/LC7 domain-containing protein [Thermoplasmata archaeon]
MSGFGALDELLSVNDVQGVVLLDRRGRVVRTHLPGTVNVPTFAVMVASMYDAAINVAEEFAKPPPGRIDVRTPSGSLVIAAVGAHFLLVVSLGTWDPDALGSRVDRVVDTLKEAVQESVAE